MHELLWFVGGALTYQLLVRILRIVQIYMFFLEIHTHMLIMLDAASQDLDTAVSLKKDLIQESGLEQEQTKLITIADEQAIDIWRATTVLKIQKFIPNAFKSTLKYENWDELKKYLNEILKDDRQ